MQSRFVRILVVLIGMAIGLAATYFLQQLDAQIQAQRTQADVVRERARRLTATIADVRASQIAYVAQGQGVPFWMTRVANLMPALQNQMAEFRGSLTTAAAHEALDPAAAALDNVESLDNRVKEHITAGNFLLAGELIFSDALEATSTAATQIAAAAAQELQAREAIMDALRRRQIEAAGGGAGAILLLMLILAVGGGAATSSNAVQVTAPPIEPVKFEPPLPRAKPAITPKLISTARLCTDLSRVNDSGQLPHLLERTSRVLDASGLIVWVADPFGRELRPALAHGYKDQMVGKMGPIACDANNAAAAAYRSAEMRTVAGDGTAPGAIVVPLTTADGCVGVLSAEMKGGAEKDECSQALAAIFAAQLATLVSPPMAAAPVKTAAQA